MAGYADSAWDFGSEYVLSKFLWPQWWVRRLSTREDHAAEVAYYLIIDATAGTAERMSTITISYEPRMSDFDERLRQMEEQWERFPGVTLEEAIKSVGPGWRALAEEAWRTVTEAGGRIRQVKEKIGILRVYFDRVSPPAKESVDRQINLLVRTSRSTCEWCGHPGEWRGHEYKDSLPEPPKQDWWFKTLCAHHAWAFYIEGERWWIKRRVADGDKT